MVFLGPCTFSQGLTSPVEKRDHGTTVEEGQDGLTILKKVSKRGEKTFYNDMGNYFSNNNFAFCLSTKVHQTNYFEDTKSSACTSLIFYHFPVKFQ